jgi:Xaa-Pro dipeptidase
MSLRPADPEFLALGGTSRPAWLSAEGVAAAQELGDRAFEPDEYAGRIERVRARLSERELDGVLAIRPGTVDYLCGHHTIEPAPQPVLVTHELVRIYVPSAEIGRVLASGCVDSIAYCTGDQDPFELITGDVASVLAKGGQIAIEDRDTSVPPRIVALLEAQGLKIVPGDYLVERLKLKLSAAELRCMERASEATKLGAQAAIEACARPAATDSMVAAAVAEALRISADSSAAMDVIVATGRRAGVTHSSFNDLPLAEGTTFIEFAGTHRRYHAPLMVTTSRRSLGPTEARLERLSQTMLAATVAEIRPGRSAAEIAKSIRPQLSELSEGDIFHFTYGYSVNHAHPPSWEDGSTFNIVVENDEPVEAGMSFHLAGSFRAFGEAGVGLSHTVVVEDAGVRILTGHSPAVVLV